MAFFIWETAPLAAEQTTLVVNHKHDLGGGQQHSFFQPGRGGLLQISLMVMDITSSDGDFWAC